MSDGTLDEVRAERSSLAAQRAVVLASLGAATADLDDRVRAAREAAESGDDTAATTADQDAEVVRQERRDLLGQIDILDSRVRDSLGKLVAADLDPCDAEPDVPLVLLPVRLETRYSSDGAVLRVRIYPDDVHVDRLDAGLSADERAAGTSYWNAVWSGGAAGEDAAWQQLVTAVHDRRAGWVAFASTPTNLAARTDPPADRSAPVFPEVADRTARPPVARALPDRFVVLARQGSEVSTAFTKPVAPEVAVGLPRDDDPSTLFTATANVGDAPLGPGMKWMVDYVAAMDIGLGVDVPLALPGEAVDTLLAFGIRASVDPDASARELRDLLLSHRFASGAAFIRQGTPTNNTETDRSAWTPQPLPAKPPTTTSAQQAEVGSNAAVLADALGIAGDALAGLSEADAAEQPLAQATNLALWGPSWGTFLDRVMAASPADALGDGTRDAVRDFYIRNVRGRGPLPAIRLGNQPYGVLPVSSVDKRWASDSGSDPEPWLLVLLHRIRAVWRSGIEGVPTIGSGGALDTALLEILGSAPQMLRLRVRSVASQSACSVVPPLLGLSDDDTSLQHTLDLILWQVLGFPVFAQVGGSLSKVTRPLGLPLVDDSDRAFIEGLLDGANGTVRSVLQALLELSLDGALRAVDAAAPTERVDEVLNVGVTVADDLAGPARELAESIRGGRFDLDEVHAMTGRLADRVGPAGPALLAVNQPIAGVRDSLAQVALQPGIDVTLQPPLALQALQAWFRAQAQLAEVRDALVTLGMATTDERRVVVAEALDCASHRLDAWITALPSRRLATMRAQRPTGVLLGAYGWVEDLQPGNTTTRDGGYVLAPSMSHAATAGILRSAYLHHNPDTNGSGAFAIDLTSSRVRDGLDILDGIRAGQPLGALLGYRFERRLQESQGAVNRFVLSLRALAPLVSRRLTDRAEDPPAEAKEAIAAANVVDGVRLLALRGTRGSAGEQSIRDSLGVRPQNPYLPTTPAWEPPTDDEWSLITGAMDEIAALYDAAADLLLAESIHQLVQGNTAGVAATLDTAAGGDAVPADPLVAQVPARGTAITHRLVVLIRDPATGAGGWATNTPRARAEPRLEAWAESVLGSADAVALRRTSEGMLTLDGAGLAALDVVYDSAVPRMLERRVRAAMPGLGPDPLAGGRDSALPRGFITFGELVGVAASLRRVLASADPVLPAAFARAGEGPKRAITAAAFNGLMQRLQVASAALRARTNALGAVLESDPIDAQQAASAVLALAGFGIAIPGAPGDATVAALAHAEAVRRLDAFAAAPPDDAPLAIAAGKLIFGDAFWMLPVVSQAGPDLFAARYDAIEPGAAPIRRFLRDHASVRRPLAGYTETLLFSDALGRSRPLSIAQLAASGTEGADRWLGLPFEDQQPSPSAPVTDVLIESPDALSGNDNVAGLLVDEWIEVAPTRVVRPGSGGTATVDALVTTGMAANVDVPNARAPQAILVAVSPDGARWSSGALADVLTETLELAKLRAVTLERAPWAGRLLPALYEQSWSLQGEEVLDIKLITTVLAKAAEMIAYVRDTT